MDKKRFLNYKRDGEKVLSIQTLYKNLVSPQAPKFSRYDFERSNTVVCPFHDDNDPSFGVLKGKDGVDRYHCFGCGVVGNYLDFYRGMEKIFNGRTLSEEQAITEIAQRYNIPVEELTVDTEKVELTREQQLERFKDMYTVADYERDLRKGLLLEKPLPFYNLNLLKLISEDIINEQEIT